MATKRTTSKNQMMQRLIRLYKEETGNLELDMYEVAKWAARKGVKPPQPKDPMDLLAKQFADAARSEIGHDPENGRPFRVYHAVRHRGQYHLFTWMDIHEAPRGVMHKSAVQRREQMVGDGVQLTLDLRYWNKIHSNEEPIDLTMDLSLDVEWRLNAPDEDDKVA